MSQLRWHAKAEEALRAIGLEGVETRPFRDILLSEEELRAIRSAFPSHKQRREIERRWGFTELIAAVSKPGGAFGPGGRALLHGYSVSSHLIHMSYEGVDLPLEREQRAKKRRAAIEAAHAARLVSDCIRFTALRLEALYRFLNLSTDTLVGGFRPYATLMSELQSAAREWHAVEYPDFASMGEE